MTATPEAGTTEAGAVAPAASASTGAPTTTETTAVAPAVASVAPAAFSPAVPAAAATETVVAPARPDGLSEALWDAQANTPKWTDIAARVARADELEQAATARAAEVPASADSYAFDIPGDAITLPNGQAAVIDKADPLAVGFAKIAHENGIPQKAVGEMLRMYVETSVANGAKSAQTMQAAIDADITAQKTALGEGADARIAAVTNALSAQTGAAGAPLAAIVAQYPGVVPALEALISKATGQPITTVQGQTAPAKSIAATWFPSMRPKAAA